jgi:hypothetical protein
VPLPANPTLLGGAREVAQTFVLGHNGWCGSLSPVISTDPVASGDGGGSAGLWRVGKVRRREGTGGTMVGEKIVRDVTYDLLRSLGVDDGVC